MFAPLILFSEYDDAAPELFKQTLSLRKHKHHSSSIGKRESEDLSEWKSELEDSGDNTVHQNPQSLMLDYEDNFTVCYHGDQNRLAKRTSFVTPSSVSYLEG